MTLFKLVDVNYKYKDRNKYILKDINIEFESGKVYSIVGRADSGKSTLLLVLSGLDDCTSGSIMYNNEDIKNLNKDMYRTNDIGIVFKENNLIKNTTIVDNIMLAMKKNKMGNKQKIKEIYEILEKFDIDKEKIKTKVSKLSDYEKKKVAIARALINNPKIIVVDDPLENLDEEEAKYIMKNLYSLAKSHNKVVIVLSRSGLITSYSDEMWGMVNGNLMFVK